MSKATKEDGLFEEVLNGRGSKAAGGWKRNLEITSSTTNKREGLGSREGL